METILVVDDDKNFRLLLEAELTLEGYEVVLADNGLAALKEIKEEAPDLVILAVKMPELQGMEVLRTILEKNKELQIIICTAYEKMQDDYTIWSGRVAAFLSKPLDLENLKDIIYELFHKQKQPGQIPET
ncbi:response regulator [Candidatus Aerophobetes bacterium]|uniref:Response regulator n=1 Tax=Aerophobetes bacterium TaxID=2030807 RepID=A0A523S4H7_UNCAE|nr:MAG: response regulator [Candidatus Aerophobetes bacterium]